jgi:hypothetical protein
MALPYIAAGIGIGLYIKGDSLQEAAFWGGTTYLGAYAITHPIQSTVKVARVVKYGFTSSLQTMGADLLAAGPTQVVAGAALGYTIGAVTGTAIVAGAESKGWVKEGSTAEVLDFYMGKGHYWDQGDMPTPGYFNIPGNLKYIWENARD